MNELRTILLAEDSPNDAELTLEALSEINIANRVITVSDGAELLEYLYYEGEYKDREKGNPAVILLDIKMPRMDGIEALTAIRNDPALKIIPVVMLTSSREELDLKRCYELGANAYVVKPVNINEFMHAVKQLGVFWALINELPHDGGK
jgi:two-component system response regulator